MITKQDKMILAGHNMRRLRCKFWREIDCKKTPIDDLFDLVWEMKAAEEEWERVQK